MKEEMLTTIDNPYNPFDNFDEWFLYDVHNGYNTCGIIARIADINDSMSEKEKEVETERAMNEIIKYDFVGIFRKISPNDKVPLSENKKEGEGGLKI